MSKGGMRMCGAPWLRALKAVEEDVSTTTTKYAVPSDPPAGQLDFIDEDLFDRVTSPMVATECWSNSPRKALAKLFAALRTAAVAHDAADLRRVLYESSEIALPLQNFTTHGLDGPALVDGWAVFTDIVAVCKRRCEEGQDVVFRRSLVNRNRSSSFRNILRDSVFRARSLLISCNRRSTLSMVSLHR